MGGGGTTGVLFLALNTLAKAVSVDTQVPQGGGGGSMGGGGATGVRYVALNTLAKAVSVDTQVRRGRGGGCTAGGGGTMVCAWRRRHHSRGGWVGQVPQGGVSYPMGGGSRYHRGVVSYPVGGGAGTTGGGILSHGLGGQVPQGVVSYPMGGGGRYHRGVGSPTPPTPILTATLIPTLDPYSSNPAPPRSRVLHAASA